MIQALSIRRFLIRQRGCHRCAPVAGLNFQMSPQLLHSFAHSHDADAEMITGTAIWIMCLSEHSVTVIADLDNQRASTFTNANESVGACSMPMHVGQAL